MRTELRNALTLLVLVSLAILLPSCAKPVVSGTERTTCRELRRDLPTWSRRDTPETLASGARFIAVFEAVCPGGPK